MDAMSFTKLSRSAFAFGLAMLVLVRCGPNPNPGGVTDTGSIQGLVLDAKTGAPIPTATVYVGTVVHNIVPADSGQFVLNLVPIGQQRLTIHAIGYLDDVETIAVAKGSGQPSLAGEGGTIRLRSSLQ
ncbi:MAG: hypothetical protein NVSMB5_19570 [Candidatus Velthaea sp.]